MANKEDNQKSIQKRQSNVLARIGGSIHLTNKLLNENDQRLIHEKVKSLKIGDQIWMSENLNVDRFRNGDPILHAESDEEWKEASDCKIPAWCYYNNDPNNRFLYGKLYNGYALYDRRGIAPSGWHVPSDEEWGQVEKVLGKTPGKKLKSSSRWESFEVIDFDKNATGKIGSGSGTNEIGFNGLPGGFRFHSGDFVEFGYQGYWWSSTKTKNGRIWLYCLFNDSDLICRFDDYMENGFSVRCLRDS